MSENICENKSNIYTKDHPAFAVMFIRTSNNDCSSELKSLFTPFAIWLPRHSSDQVKVTKMTNLSDLDMSQRLTYAKVVSQADMQYFQLMNLDDIFLATNAP